MDDTTLIASDCEGLTNMLSITQEFYDLNNTKINFNKAILICNRSPDDIHKSLGSSPSAHTFIVDATRQFTITPIAPKESFRFLGVWFSLSMSPAFIKKQCRSEYSLFASKLRNKKLTSDQLTYLHNAILLPKVEYRLKATCLTENECLTIQAPFRKLFKNTLSMVSSLPNALLHYRQGLNFTSLFQKYLTNHINNLTNIFSMDNSSTVFCTISHRLMTIQKDINIPYSPLLLSDFSCFLKTKCFKTDFIFRLLFFSGNIGISFARPLPASQSVENHTPLFSLFNNNPSLYRQSLPLLKKHNQMFLSDCISRDKLTIMSYRDIINKNSSYKPTKSAKWYDHIIDTTRSSPNSLRLKPEYTSPIPSALANEGDTALLPTIEVPTRSGLYSRWCGAWDYNSDTPIFGRLILKNPYEAVFQHWTRVLSAHASSLTPTSIPLQLIECRGCSLHESLAAQPAGRGRPNPVFASYPCLMWKSHNEVVDLSSCHTGRYTRTDIHTFCITFAQATSNILQIGRA